MTRTITGQSRRWARTEDGAGSGVDADLFDGVDSSAFARDSEVFPLVLGSDAYNSFARWKAPDAILKIAHLVVCLRPGSQCEMEDFAAHRVESVEALQSRSAGAILTLEVDAPDCASRELRRQIAAGLPPDDCLSDAVAQYIDTHQLYRESQ